MTIPAISGESFEHEPSPAGAFDDHLRAHLALAGADVIDGIEEPEPSDEDWAELGSLRGLLNLNVCQPVFETFFFPIGGLAITRDQLRELVPAARFELGARGLYPSDAPASTDSRDLTSHGWVVRALRGPDRPSWGWALGHGGTFLDRQDYWEDYPPTQVRMVGCSWLATRTCLVLHLLHRCVQRLNVPESKRFVVGIRLTGTDGRCLLEEGCVDTERVRPATRQEVEVHGVLRGVDLRRGFRGIATRLVEAVAWDMERTDARQHVISAWVDKATAYFGRPALFPDDRETTAP